MGPISQDFACYLLSDSEKVATRCTEPVRFSTLSRFGVEDEQIYLVIRDQFLPVVVLTFKLV